VTKPRTIPFLRPSPARLSELSAELAAIEASGTYTNYGPVNGRFEAALVASVFGGIGACLTVANATIGLMLAIREQVPARGRGYALMPSFTFAATAHAAIWCGLTPLLVDIDPETWLPDASAEERLLDQFGDEIACLVPYACFGNELDLERYASLAERHGVAVVIDAAASLGSQDARGRGSGTGSTLPLVFSLHATKTFATSEAGLIYAADTERIERLRAMANFGFVQPRVASLPGLNGKLPEVAALLGLKKLEQLDSIVAHRTELATRYRERLGPLQFQRPTGSRQANQFMPVLLPDGWGPRRADVLERLRAAGVDAKHYFSPHLAEQPFVAENARVDRLDVTTDVAARILSLPLWDDLTLDEVDFVCEQLDATMQAVG
jgi:dTDP-4-amino-4,6-dideoxygalactose transaminase